MASTRESSPARESTPDSPAQLSPNSKVKALLATLSDDSDNESASGSARARVLKSLKNSKASKTTDSSEGTKPNEPAATSPSSKASAIIDEEDEDEEEIVPPRGRLAARMQAEDNDSEDVQPSVLSKSKSPTPAADTQEENASDEDDISVAPKRRRIRKSHQDTPKSSPARRSVSPGLFVSPAKSQTAAPAIGDANDDSDDSLPDNPVTNARFQALVAKKRAEREARNEEEKKERERKAAEKKKFTTILDREMEAWSDDEGSRRLTQSSRPSRKAGKKAMEEMHRETQRLSRNQQLAHNAITKKKITKESLFAKFNFRIAKQEEGTEPSRPASSSSPPFQSDVEMRETPPTSPAAHDQDFEKTEATSKNPQIDDHSWLDKDGELPNHEVALTRLTSSPSAVKLDKGKGKEIQAPSPEPVLEKRSFFKHQIRARPSKIDDSIPTITIDSDSDLEIVPVKTPKRRSKIEAKIDAVFDKIPARKEKESSALYALKMFAGVKSPGKQSLGRDKRPSMNQSELQFSLQQRAREQAAREREDRLNALRAKGVVVQTAEEREKEMVELEDLLSKARRDDEQLAKQERAASKKERKDNGEEGAGDSSDDEDWEESKKKELGVASSDDDSMEGSEEEGSEVVDEEEEEDEEEMDVDEEAEALPLNPMFDDEAGESDVDETKTHLALDEEIAEDGDIDEEDEQVAAKRNSRRMRHTNVISDDEDSDEDDLDKTQLPMQTPIVSHMVSPMQISKDSPKVPNSVLRSATKTFIPGLTVAGPAGLGLTQIFAGTMDDSQVDPFGTCSTAPIPESPQLTKNDSFSFIRGAPAPELPPFVPTMSMEDTQVIENSDETEVSRIPESQPTQDETQGIQLNFNQSQIHGFDSLVESDFDTPMSQFPEPTQDVGFQHMTPMKGRFSEVPTSTVDTVMLESTAVPETIEETPIVKKKGRLHRRVQVPTFSDDEEEPGEVVAPVAEDEDFDITANAFDVMRKASKKKPVVEEFDKKNSKAKEMVHDQAEESEDEYAGLGGASDDESAGEEDEYVKAMIDDEAGNDADESKLAALFADRERASDEKQVEKLYKDITSGMLRRKRGADYDLSDSDDGGQARQRMKRKEFAKMRKALLADERIGKIAENPKKEAFLRAIEDRDSGDEIDFLGDFEEEEAATDSQSQSQGEGSQQVIPDSQPLMGPPKRKHPGDAADSESRPPPYMRRTRPNKKPSNLAEIRDSLSSLIEEPNEHAANPDSDSEDDLEIEEGEASGSGSGREKENRDPFALRRTHAAVIDRITLKRQSSSMISNSTKLAFATSSSVPGFKVPALLKRATTNNSMASTNSSVSGGMSATERMAGGASGSDRVKRGGGKNSGVNYFARESERRAAVVKTEKRRERKLVKGAESRRKVVGGLFGGGKFE